MEQTHFSFSPLLAHAPYTLNPCSADEKVRAFAHLAMREDLEKMEMLPHNLYNFHPGSHVGQGVEEGIIKIVDLLNTVLKPEMTTTIPLDSKNPFSSHKDRHEKIGEGSIGIEAFERIINHPKLKHLPFYLETPNELEGYAEEIKLLKGLSNE